MTTTPSLPATAILSVADRARSTPKRRRSRAATWRWLVHNVRVALHAGAEEDHALHHWPEVLRELIHRAGVALVTTRDGDGRLHTQPMAPVKREFDGEIWFPVTAAMPLVDHLLGRPEIQVTYLDPDSSHRCVVVDGIARVFEAPADADARWRDRFAIWRSPVPRAEGPAYVRVDVMCADVWE